MTAETTIRRNGFAEFAYLEGTYVWHGMGNSFNASASLEEIRQKAGMDWECIPKTTFYEHNGERFTVTDRVIQARSDTGAALGAVSSGFQTVQPGDVIEFFRDLVESIGLQITTAGTLFGGRKLFASAYVGEQSMIDDRDRVRSYLLLSTALDGSMATTARYTTVCVVCNNTLMMANRGEAPVRVIHSAKFNADEAKKTLGVAPRSFDTFMDNMRRLANAPLSEDRALELTNKVFTTQDGPTVDRVMNLFRGEGLIGVDLEGRHGTAWAWLNAVTQFSDHERRAMSDSHRLNSSLFGRADKNKSAALKLVMAEVG
jgi:phage/plasmid-like protein (TIGR03299 family)